MEKKAAGGGGVVKQPPPEKSLMMIPPDEERCCRTDGVRWRCTKFRMNLGVSNDDGLDTKYCENHYNFYKERNKKLQLNRSKLKQQQLKNRNHQQQKKKLKKKISSSSEDDDDDGSSSSSTETWDSNSLERKKIANHSKEIQQPTTSSNIQSGSSNVGTKRKMKKLPPDEQNCGRTGGGGWRCKNFRMGHGCDDSVPKSRLCEKHYNLRAKYNENLKKRSKDGEGAVQKQGATIDDTSVTIVDGGTRNIRRKRKNVKDDLFIDHTLGESEHSDGYVDSENFLGDLMDMLGMENWDWNNDEMKWNSEADMLSSFEEDPVLFYL